MSQPYQISPQQNNNVLPTKNTNYLKKSFLPQTNKPCIPALDICRRLINKVGVHSSILMESAGFEYTNQGDAARCPTCKLEVSGWTTDMKPFTIHSQRSPTCSLVQSMLPAHKIIPSPSNNFPLTTTASNDGEQPLKKLKIDRTVTNSLLNLLVEVDLLKQVRKRTFSHWPHKIPSSSQMIAAGFFNCNVGDRVICIYCNIICQQWTPNIDDPCEVHKTLSPKCVYVLSMLNRSPTSSILVINEHSTSDQTSTSVSSDPFRCNAIVYTAACNTAYIEIPKRYASFANWPTEKLPSVDDLVRAGFFFTGTKTIVTCFYCNGSLQNWGSNDNPTIEHARWFPNCAYAKQLCGAELYRKIQESKRAQQERARTNDSSNGSGTSGSSPSHGQLVIQDESTLSRFVAARLDLPISQSLLTRGFKLSIIKRCWEDQLRIKRGDFISDNDLLMACTILQKQIEGIDGKKENIIVPSVAMTKLREKEAAEARAREQEGSGASTTNISNNDDVEMTASSTEPSTTDTNVRATTATNEPIKNLIPSTTEASVKTNKEEASPANPCVLCLTEEKRLACIPCGHLATCVPCGHSLRSCPICRREIDAFVRIYI